MARVLATAQQEKGSQISQDKRKTAEQSYKKKQPNKCKK
jgi:hypothetical protein